jgi:hypothetical protein
MTVRESPPLVVWWRDLSRAYQNAIVLLVFDLVLFTGFLLDIRSLKAAWEATTGFLPNIYAAIVIPAIGLAREVFPGAFPVVNGVAIDVVTTFFSLLSMHLVVGFGLGFLFDQVRRDSVRGFLSFLTLILVLFTVHFFLIVAAYV